LDITLKCGQSFRWKTVESEGEKIFISVLQKQILALKQDEEHVYYSGVGGDVDQSLLQDYFNLSVDLPQLYKQWSLVDPIFLEISRSYPGVRMLRQDPVENLFSFICSANNNIQRISGMVQNMSKEYGELCGELEGESHYAFPSLSSLAKSGVEGRLRELGFGYRARYIEESARKILEQGGEPWLHGLRDLDYTEAKESLLKLSGVGPKVADCILLMSLDQPSSVPVDTHVFQIAKQYLPHLNQTKTVTARVYAEIGDYFRNLYGEYAGWAHSVLFSADLKHLRDLKQETVADTTGIKQEIKTESIEPTENTKPAKKDTKSKATKGKAVKQEKLVKLEAKPVQKVTRKPAKGLAKVEAQHSKPNKRKSSQRCEPPSKKGKPQ